VTAKPDSVFEEGVDPGTAAPSGPTYAIDPAGRAVKLSPNQLREADAANFRAVSKDYAEGTARGQANKDYVDQNWGTAGQAAMGLGSGLTLGLGPALAARSGLVDPGHLEAAEGSGAFQAGDIAGMLVPALLSGGAAAGAEGGSSIIGRALAATPAGLLGRGGSLAERLVGRMLPEAGLMGRLATPTIQMAARGATEGALVNMAHTTSEDIIHNKPLAAQSLLASGLDGALFGGVTGGIIGGASSLAGVGLDAASGRVARGLAGGAATEERAAQKALGHLGASEGEIVGLGERFNHVPTPAEVLARKADTAEGGVSKLVSKTGDVSAPTRGMYEILQDGDASLASKTSVIRQVARETEQRSAVVARDALESLQRESPSVLDGRLSVMSDRIKSDVHGQFVGQLEYGAASNIANNISKKLESLGEGGTWSSWAASREQLADAVLKSSGTKQAVYKTALNAFDDELVGAMQRANPELASQWASAVTKQRLSTELLDLTVRKEIGEANKLSAIHLSSGDAGTAGYTALGSVVSGHNPLLGLGVVAAKKLIGYAQEKMAPAIAEAAYRNAIGANAAHAQAVVGQRVSSGLKKFLTGARIAAESNHASEKPSYTMESYKRSKDQVESLSSMEHQARVRDLASALSGAGHPELSQEMANTYGRATAYAQSIKPKEKAPSLSKPLVPAALDGQMMKFLRSTHAMVNPVGAIVGGLERGDVSRDAVAAVKYVYPDLHADIVERAGREILAMKQEGKFVPADKVALLGMALDAPIDSTLSKDFVAAVQQAHAAQANAQKPQQSQPEKPVDISQFQTPLQATA